LTRDDEPGALQPVANFLFEVGMLRRTPRSGLQFSRQRQRFGRRAHPARRLRRLRARQLGAEVDRTRLTLLCLLHDLPEARTGDLNYENKKYVHADEAKAIRDMASTVPFGADLEALLTEFNAAKRWKSRLAHDADQLELLLVLKEEKDRGNPQAEDWIGVRSKRLQHPVSQRLGDAILATHSSDLVVGRPRRVVDLGGKSGPGRRRPRRARSDGRGADRMLLRAPRSLERLRHHYEVEKTLAARLKATANPPSAPRSTPRCTTRLFAQVPDHPRLTMQRDPAAENLQVQRLLSCCGRSGRRPPNTSSSVPGPVRLRSRCVRSSGVCVRSRSPIRSLPTPRVPANFELVLYDGFHLEIAAASVDVVFSEQFVEHLHPDDAEAPLPARARHPQTGGRYVLRTPERWTGPHDISRWFSETPQGFHLREWSYRDLGMLAARIGFSRRHAYWNARGIRASLPWPVATGVESFVSHLPLGLRPQPRPQADPMVTVELVR
jgi:putative hydrolase of HD superfamily